MAKIISINRQHYSELHQSHKVQFAWMDETEEGDFIMQHYWVNCRDFLGDALVAARGKFDIDIYEFAIDHDKFKETDFLGIRFGDKDKRNAFIINLAQLNAIEEKNGIPKTCFLAQDRLRAVVDVAPFWRQSNVTLSLYTYLIKVFSIPGDNPWENLEGYEASYYLSVEKYLTKLLDNLSKLKYPSIMEQYRSLGNLSDFHNSTGFVSYFRGRAENELKRQLEQI